MNSSEKIHRGMVRQLQDWHTALATPGQRLGWKIGFGVEADQKRFQLPSAMIGYLSQAQRISSNQTYQASPTSKLLVEPEVAVQIGCNLPADASHAQANSAIIGYSAALELVDTTRSSSGDIEAILAGNLFHEAVLLSEQLLPPGAYSRKQLGISLYCNHELVRTLEQDRVPDDFASLILTVARVLSEHGEQLQAGDWIIMGAAAKPVPVQAGDEIRLDMGNLGHLALTIA